MLHRNDVQLVVGDCLTVLRDIACDTVQCVYLDPPFLTQKSHKLKPRDRSRTFSFDDIWSSDQEYGAFLHDRLLEMRRVLAPTGSIFFHCDRTAGHIARGLLDRVFGCDQFRAEIIWTYRRWSNGQRNLLPAHQTIYYYTKTEEYKFHTYWDEYSPSTNVDQILQRRARDAHGKAVYQRDENGDVVIDARKQGVPLSDVWDIPYLNPKARERTGYPTQKPLLLLERILRISTDPNDLVLDPFCGSGTTVVAAQQLGRLAVGIDISQEAIDLAQQRLKNPIRSESGVLERGRDAYRNADTAALALLDGLDYVPVQRNKGIDAILTQEGVQNPITVRVQRPNETVAEAAHLLHKASISKAAEVMILVATTRSASLLLGDDIPPGVRVVESPALRIADEVRAACQRP